MVAHTSSHAEPTPEFMAQCQKILERWRVGELPFADAVAKFSTLAQQASQEGHSANLARAEQLLGYLQHYRGNYNISIMHNDRARTLYERVGNRARVITLIINQGENYRFKGEYKRAISLYDQAYGEASELGDIRSQSIALLNKGLALLSLQEYDAAREALQHAYTLSEQWPDQHEVLPDMQIEIHHGLVEIFLHEGDYEAAWEQAMLAMAAARLADKPVQYGYAYRLVARVLTALGQSPDPAYTDEPDEYFRRAVAAFRDVNAEGELARTMFEHARSLANRGRNTRAARKLQQVMMIFTKLGMTDDAAQAAELQRQLL